MTDIVKQLRWCDGNPICLQAADEIERLRGALEHLSLYVAANGDDWVQRQARAYLAGEKAPVQPPAAREALQHVLSSAQTGTYDGGVVISFAALESVRRAAGAADPTTGVMK